jgi:hypothetical protein
MFSFIGFYTSFLHRAWPCRKIGSRRSPRFMKWKMAPGYWTRSLRAMRSGCERARRPSTAKPDAKKYADCGHLAKVGALQNSCISHRRRLSKSRRDEMFIAARRCKKNPAPAGRNVLVRPSLLVNAIMEMNLKEHFAPLGLGVINNGGSYKHGVPTGLDAASPAFQNVRTSPTVTSGCHPPFPSPLFG